MMNKQDLWHRYQRHFCFVPNLGISLDISRMKFEDDFFDKFQPAMLRAYAAMEALEKGSIANPDEKRMVGHYWLRAPELAPNKDLSKAITSTLKQIQSFTKDVHKGKITPERGGTFTDLLVIGIGGSALGPQFVSHALGQPSKDRMRVWFFDNTDPDGMDLTLAQIGKNLPNTLAVVISKSGSTKETRNGQLEAKAAFEKAGLTWGKHAVAVTGEGSELAQTATREKWLAQFPMWDWVGGRTSELSAVGLLPAALQGIDIQEMLEGAAEMDRVTRTRETTHNPAALLATMWYYATGGKGTKDMVILPYKDRLLLFSRYLQQLVMESLGKELDLTGKPVYQGISVYGNKGSTDQHAYIQQLREGVLNFFATFIEVLKDRDTPSMKVEPGATSGDYLQGFFLGTREALYEKNRESMTLTIPDVSAKTIGALIALYERAVGFYGFLVGINSYHQPGVEAGKKAATAVLALQGKVIQNLAQRKGEFRSADEIAKAIGSQDTETIYHILVHQAANADRKVQMKGDHPHGAVFAAI